MPACLAPTSVQQNNQLRRPIGIGRSARWQGARLLVYPILVAGGVKLVFEDLRAGSASTLFVSLAAYGSALILAHRVTRRP